MFAIIGISEWGTEEIDTFDTVEEARAMLAEYRLAMPTFLLSIQRVTEGDLA